MKRHCQLDPCDFVLPFQCIVTQLSLTVYQIRLTARRRDDPLEEHPYAGDKASKSNLLASFSVAKVLDPGFGQICVLLARPRSPRKGEILDDI